MNLGVGVRSTALGLSQITAASVALSRLDVPSASVIFDFTDEQGQGNFPHLPPGTYRVSAEAPGFATHSSLVQIGASASQLTMELVEPK